MTNKEKLEQLKTEAPSDMTAVSYYYKMLEAFGDMKYHYYQYLSTPLCCDDELKRIDTADYDLACALLTMLLREDYFCNYAFVERYKQGDVQRIINRMIMLLEEKEYSNN